MSQGVLPLQGATLCGYCLHPLEVATGQPELYECPECAPCLASVATVEDWRAFARAAWKRRKKGAA